VLVFDVEKCKSGDPRKCTNDYFGKCFMSHASSFSVMNIMLMLTALVSRSPRPHLSSQVSDG